MSGDVEFFIADKLAAHRRELLMIAEALKSCGDEWPDGSVGCNRFADAVRYVQMAAQSLESTKACIGHDRKT